MTDKELPVKLFRNRKTDRRILVAEEPNGDLICGEMDKNDKVINAGNRNLKEEFNKDLDDWNMEADHNTVGFTFFGGQFVERKRPERL